LRFKAERLSLKFLNRLAASRISKKGLCEDPWLKPLEADVLLRTTLKGLDLNYGGSQKETNIAVALQKFVFGYARENILSFDSSLSMRQSVRDLSATAGVDIKFDYRKTLEATRCSISTLPLHVSINLQRLDETFGWLGGLSSVINMTASMGQSVMMTTPSPTKPKRKGVSFDTPIKPDDESPGSASENKIDARIGGFVLDLIGKDCSIAIDTTALKVVSRDEGLGLAIDKIKLTGPHVRVIGGDPAIFAEVSGTRIEFLSSPKGSDLDRLLALITPSKTKFDPDDDVMIDPLVRQRRQGSVLRVTVDHFLSRITQIEQLKYLPELGEELAKLSTVAKYLPEDDRPGLLSLVLIRDLDASVDLAANIGVVRGKVTDLQVAHITFPALIAGSVLNMTVDRNSSEELLGIGVSTDHLPAKDHAPMIMGRWIGDEPHPKIKLKLNNLKADYRVSTIMAFLNLDYATGEELLAGVAESIVTLTDRVSRSIPSLTERPQSIIPVHDGPEVTPPVIELHVAIRDCILGLNPYGSPSKMLFVMSEAQIEGALNQDQTITALVEMVRSSILVIDDISNVVPKSRMTPNRRYSYDGGSLAVNDLCSQGYVSVGSLSEAKVHITVKPSANPEHDDKFIDVAFTDDLIVLESCADSTQTLFSILGALSPPTPPSKRKTAKYRTTTMPLDDLLASFSGDAFEAPDVEFDVEKAFGSRVMSESDVDTANLELDEDFYGIDHSHHSPNATSHHGSVLFDGEGAQEHDDGVLLESFTSKQHVHTHEPLVFLEDHFDSKSYSEQTSVLWNSDTGEFEPSDFKTKDSPFKVVVTNVHLIWNLFDGYDWQHTRDVIAKSAQDVENKATQKRKQKKRKSNSQATDMDSDEDETVIGDFLFNSIYIGIPGNRDPAELTGLINERLGVDNATETESVAQTQASISSKRPGVGTPKSTAKKLRLKRSKHHKMAIELKGVDVNFLTVPQGSHETEAIASIRVKDLTIFDHMPTSTWKKFATYAHDHGQREAGASQLSIDMAIVRPVASLPVTEFAIKANILPLRIHADQDAVEFIERFFAFKDERGPASDPESDPPFIQKCEVLEIPVLLDFKPKRVDYGGLRAGNTTELMNFIILDTSRMKLRHAIVRGCPGFDRLGKCLNDLWMPDVKASQLPGVLAGLAPIRSAANIGDGVAELIRVPMREYKKDGRLMRALGKGALRFAKTSGTEVVKLSAKVAIGTQNILEGAEELLAPERAERSNRTRAISAGWDEDGESDDDDDGNDGKGKVISLYADQPVNVIQGAKTAWRGLERDLMVARDAVIAVPGEVRESGSAMGAGKAVLKAAPTIVLRPMVGVSKALGKALLGAGNTLDPENLRRAEDVSYIAHWRWCFCGGMRANMDCRNISGTEIHRKS
jgi:autophagy-related protein 2